MNMNIPNRFARRKERTRNALKKAVIELILEKGYDDLTIEAITDRADLGRGTFYIHFEDKNDILWEIMKDGIDTVDRETNVRYAMEKPKTPEYLGFLVTFEHANKNRELYQIMFGGRGSAMLSNRMQKYLADEIEREIRNSRVFTDFNLPPLFIAQYLTGALVRVLIWWLEIPNEYTPTQMAAMFYEMTRKELPPNL